MKPIPFACPACAATDAGDSLAVLDREYGVPYTAHYVECRGCGTLSQVPMPSFEQLGSFYPSTYHAANARGLLARARHRARLKSLESFLQLEDLLPGLLQEPLCPGPVFLQAFDFPSAVFLFCDFQIAWSKG